MKFISITVTSSRSLPDAAAIWYDQVRKGCEVLPPPDRLLRAVAQPTQFFAWLAEQKPSPDWAMSCYYLEPLTNDPEADSTNEFLIRLEKSIPDGSNMPMTVHIIGTEVALVSVRLAFSHRGNMFFAGRCLHDLQEELTGRHIRWDSIQILIEGIRTESKTMRETMLPAFKWNGREMFHLG